MKARALALSAHLEARIAAEVSTRFAALSCVLDFQRAAGVLDLNKFWFADRFAEANRSNGALDSHPAMIELRRLARRRIENDVRAKFNPALEVSP